jgi:hypothetical protein
MCSYIFTNLDIDWNWQIARIISFITIIRCEYVTKSVVISHYTLQRYKIFGNKICCLDCIHGLNCIQYNMCSASKYLTIFVESRSKWTMNVQMNHVVWSLAELFIFHSFDKHYYIRSTLLFKGITKHYTCAVFWAPAQDKVQLELLHRTRF